MIKIKEFLQTPRNGNIHFQIFCDLAIDPTRPLTNYKLLDAIAMEEAEKKKTTA